MTTIKADEFAPPPRTAEEEALEKTVVSRIMGSFFANFESELASQLSRQSVIDAIRFQLLELSKSRLAEAKLQVRGLIELLASRVESFAAEPVQQQPEGLLMPPRPQGQCRSHRDGDCDWPGCPQLRDGEPARSGRPCPLLNKHAPFESSPAPPAAPGPRVRPEERAEAILSSEQDGPMSELLHTLWTKAVGTPDYDKYEWQALEIVLYRMRRKIHGDYLP
jgi:hypothetical protein